MTTWTIRRCNGCAVTITVEADEITTRQDGSLWLLCGLDPKPAPLVPVLILASGEWAACDRADCSPLLEETP